MSDPNRSDFQQLIRQLIESHIGESPSPTWLPTGDSLAMRYLYLERQKSEIEAENKRLREALAKIHELAHDLSTGPSHQDGYWEIRGIAGEEL